MSYVEQNEKSWPYVYTYFRKFRHLYSLTKMSEESEGAEIIKHRDFFVPGLLDGLLVEHKQDFSYDYFGNFAFEFGNVAGLPVFSLENVPNKIWPGQPSGIYNGSQLWLHGMGLTGVTMVSPTWRMREYILANKDRYRVVRTKKDKQFYYEAPLGNALCYLIKATEFDTLPFVRKLRDSNPLRPEFIEWIEKNVPLRDEAHFERMLIKTV